MKEEELKDIDIEISILSPLKPLEDVKTIQVGKHGLFIVRGKRSGLLLPQVATEHGWDRETFLINYAPRQGLRRTHGRLLTSIPLLLRLLNKSIFSTSSPIFFILALAFTYN